MKMTNFSQNTSKIVKSTSFSDLIISRKDYSGYLKGESFCKSADNLPEAVAECYQDASLIGRIHNSILFFVGRGCRYKLKTTQSCSFLKSLLGSKKKKEVKQEIKDLTSVDKRDQITKKDYKTNIYVSSTLPNRQKITSKTKQPQSCLSHITDPIVEVHKTSPDFELANSKFSYTRRNVNTSHDEEIILRQYMSLQQMALARRHCNQLRKIRDSLVERARPKAKNSPSQEQKELRNFLLDVGFVQYYAPLNRHGYDFETATHMDVLDLAAVGISEPLHRMALKYELDQVRIPIKALENIPVAITEWLNDIGLPEYVEHFQQNGFYCPLAAVGLSKRDLQLLGIYMLGHRKKLVLALAAVNLTLTKNNTDFCNKKVL